ncbi:MAG: hypothetical protein JST73_00815, partial [Actinobacteria bacterium]|nr:hypothetical protein [Actinomycetota bacterium]
GGRGGGGGSDRDGDGDDHDGHGARADRRSRSLTRLRPTAALRAGRVLEAVVGACRPGAVGAHIRRTAIDAGGSIPADGLVYGIGMGVEPPVIGPDVGDGVVLEADMVLAVCAWVADAREGGWYERRLVRVVPDGNGPAELIGSEPLPPVGPVTLRRGDAQ